MKRTIYLLITISFCFSLLNAEDITIENNYGEKTITCSKRNNQLSIDFSLKSYSIENVQNSNIGFKKISIPNEGLTKTKGLPELPQTVRLIALENDGNPYINLLRYETEVIEDIIIFPSQFVNGKISSEFEFDQEYYNNGDIFPKEIVRIGKPAIFRDYRVANLIINPFQYDPKRQQLTLYKNIEFEILYSFEEETINPIKKNRAISRSFESIYSSSIINYDLVQNRSTEYQKPCLLIIGRQAHPVDYLQDFINWKHRKGFEVIFVISEEEDFDGEEHSSIRTFIQNAYDSWENQPEYIIVLGEGRDNHFSDIEPVYFQDEDGHPYRSDQPYCMVAGDDLLPDLIIGRLPLNQSTYLAQNVITKLLDYEINPYLDSNWFEEIFLVSDPTYNFGDSYIHSKITTNEYIQSIIPNENDNYNIDFQIFPNQSPYQIIHKLDDGISFYNFLGDLQFGGIDSSEITSLSNGPQLPFISAITCGTGYYYHNGHQNWGLARLMVQQGTPSIPKGAVSFIGSSNNYTHTIYNNHFSSGIASGIFNDKAYKFGGALAKGQLTLYNAFFDQALIDGEYRTLPNAKHTMRWNNLWGDPTIELWTDVPKEMVLDYPETVPYGENYIEIAVTNIESEPIENALVCLLKQIDTGEDIVDEVFETFYTDENGFVMIPYSALTTGTMFLTATKHNYIPHLGSFEIVEDELSVNYFEVVIDDDNYGNSAGNNNGMVNPGEQIELDIILKNFGSVIAENVTAEISTEHSNINIINNSAEYGEIEPGSQAYSDNDFILSIGSNCHNEDVYLNLTIQDDLNNTYNGIVVLPITGYDAEFEEITGNISPDGSTDDISIALQNTGEITTPPLYAKLVNLNNELILVDDTGNYNPIEPEQTGISTDVFTIIADNAITPGSLFHLSLELYTDETFQTLFKNLSIPLIIGSPTIADPLGPDSYGYLCYDDGDAGYDDVPLYEWIDINEIGNQLSDLNQEPGDNDLGAYNQVINLPFEFKFYGENYSEKLTISSAGWVSFGNHNEEAFYNSPLPGPLGPSSMIAPFWDEMDYVDNVSNACYHYDHVKHKLIIQWNAFHNNYSQAEETFQLILYDPAYYPTISKDGLIKMQYKVVNNDDQNACYASVGLEDHTQSIGLEYTYYNNYPEAAKELEDEMAILFTTGVNRPEAPLNVQIGSTMNVQSLYLDDGNNHIIDGTLNAVNGIYLSNGTTMEVNGYLNLNSCNLFVTDGSYVTINGTLEMDGGSSIEFIQQSHFTLNPGCTVLGCTPRIYYNELDYEPGDRIIVQDESIITVGDEDDPTRITITTSTPNPNQDTPLWEGITIRNLDYSVENLTFYNCDMSYFRNLVFQDDNESMTVKLNDINFTNAGQIRAQELKGFMLYGEDGNLCNISNNSATPLAIYETQIEIDYCNIADNNGKGIYLGYPPPTMHNDIRNTVITGNTSYGVYCYHTPITINNCIIEDNLNHGLASIHLVRPVITNSIVQNNGIANVTDYYNGAEIIASYGAFPDIPDGNNTFYDGDNSGDMDNWLFYMGGWNTEFQPVPVWGNDYPNNDGYDFDNPNPQFSIRFFPYYNAFDFDEGVDDAEQIYGDAEQKIISSDIQGAKDDFKYLIQNYPGKDYFVSASLSWLYYLEKFEGKNFEELREYLEGITVPPNQDMIVFNLVAHTYASQKDYETALTMLEDTIQNPPSEDEQICALINEGYYYLKAMEENPENRSILNCTVKPRNFEEFMKLSKRWEEDLRFAILNNTPDISKLASTNYPNPFNPTTTISFNIPASSNVDIEVYNIKGQKVKTLLNEYKEAGEHQVVWHGRDESNKRAASGLYLYKIISGKETVTRKMLLLK